MYLRVSFFFFDWCHVKKKKQLQKKKRTLKGTQDVTEQYILGVNKKK